MRAQRLGPAISRAQLSFASVAEPRCFKALEMFPFPGWADRGVLGIQHAIIVFRGKRVKATGGYMKGRDSGSNCSESIVPTLTGCTYLRSHCFILLVYLPKIVSPGQAMVRLGIVDPNRLREIAGTKSIVC